jgi:DNA-binding FadR family transcriptional regulator
MLDADGPVTHRPRSGARVSEIAEWNLLDPDVLAWMFSSIPRPELIHGVFELRTIIEPEAAALAALRRKQHQLDQMRRALDKMSRHTLYMPEGREADRAFHAALLASTCNPFIISLTNGVTAAVEALTRFKQRLVNIDRDPVPDHVLVYEAIAARDPDAARSAMVKLIHLAIQDMPLDQRPEAPSESRTPHGTPA